MDFNSNYQALIHRPRVSFMISEYAVSYTHLTLPTKLEV